MSDEHTGARERRTESEDDGIEPRSAGSPGNEGQLPRLCSGASPDEVAGDLLPLVEFQDEGLSLDRLQAMVEERLIPHLMRYDLPSFHALFNAFPEEGAEYGARVALEWNQGVTNWQVSPGGAVLEELCCRALCRLFGLPAGADATVLYCGTYANQQALYMALHHRAERIGVAFTDEGLRGFPDPSRLTVVTSADAHFSLKHAVRVMGLGEQALVTVEVDGNRRMDVEALRATLAQGGDERDVFCVVATAGTTSTGSVDPVSEIAEVCAEHGAWLHVDGAYGLAYALVPEWSHLFQGIEQADTVSWDPHKQLSVPIPSSILFARRRDDFARVALFSHYWNRPDAEGPNPGVKSMPSTRPLTALPLVTSIRHQGLAGVVDRLRRPLEAIRALHDALREEEDIQVCHEPDTGILCFRLVPPSLPEDRLDRLQELVYEMILKEGSRLISVTKLDDRAALRLVAISPDVTVEAMLETVAEARRIAESFA